MNIVLAVFAGIAAIIGLGLLWWRWRVVRELRVMSSVEVSGAEGDALPELSRLRCPVENAEPRRSHSVDERRHCVGASGVGWRPPRVTPAPARGHSPAIT